MPDRRVLFFGDSFVTGVGDPTGAGWVGRVVAGSFAAGLPLTPYILGVRRETSVQVAARWRTEAQPRLLGEADCRVVFSFGTNDTTVENGSPRVDANDSARTLAGVLDDAKAMTLPVFVVGPSPVDHQGQRERIRRLSASFAAVCAQRQVAFVSVVDQLASSALWMSEIATGDGAHPGEGGYSTLAQLVLTAGWLDWLRADTG